MLTLAQACKPRASVFDAARRDSVVDLTELAANRIDAAEFFAENYPTAGMRTLIEQAFRRFGGRSDQGTFLLTQAMGGGKTHLMVALGLLARNPKLVKQYFPEYQNDAPPPVKVVAFSGRESDAPYGIWGAIAEQLGKKEVFHPYYQPLKAPGQTAWINLLQGPQPLLILLDELPPYFENARSIAIGDSNLATVTMTALSNLLAAVCKDELKQVCVVMSDLAASYNEGSGMVQGALATMEKEANRTALRLEPVQLNTDELYHILRTRIFEELPDDQQIAEVADGYADVLRQARQMDLTGASPEEAARQIQRSYPFHFSLRDLYARFRENPGFQQTRGLIRLMRMVVADMYAGSKIADRAHLVHPYHVNLNDAETVSEIGQINPTLRNAVSHDIASGGGSVAEQIDRDLGDGSTDAVDAARLFLMASLANVPHALRGLTEEEAVALLATPGRALSRLQKQVLDPLLLTAWYLHTGTDNRIFFKDVQNLVARLKTTAQALTHESQIKELRSFLADLFKPALKDCYQEVAALPALDQVTLRADHVTLLIFEPYSGAALHPDLEAFYSQQEFKNRVMFLSGDRNTMARILEVAAELKAVHIILDEMKAEKIPESDPQHKAARDLQDKIKFQLLSAARECFTRLTFPSSQGLTPCDFLMQFNGNEYNGEKQIRDVLSSRQKFTEDVDSDTFRKKCEQRLFTREELPWSDVMRRAATNPAWQWHHPGALDGQRKRMLDREQWRENGGYVHKGPFPPPVTEVRISQIARDDKGKVTLRLTPVNGDRILYELGGGAATTASMAVPDPKQFQTSELKVSFLCVDSAGLHQTGDAASWENTIDLRYRIYQNGADRMVEWVAAPTAAIRYTTDGSDPQQAGGVYDGPIRVPASTVFVQAVAQSDGVVSKVVKAEVPREVQVVDPKKAARWNRKQSARTTPDAFALLGRLKKHAARVRGARVYVSASKGQWTELSFSEDMPLAADVLEKSLEFLRPLVDQGQVEIEAPSIDFETGQHLLDWANEEKAPVKADEVRQ